MTFTVRPSGEGGWFAFASGPRLLVTPAHDDGFVDAAWLAISQADGFRLSLDLLTSGGLAATPPFVLVEWVDGADARVIVRGDSPLSVVDASGSQPLSAAGVSTWVERSIAGVTGIEFTVPGSAPVGSASLPLLAGVALVAQVALGASVAASPGPAAAPSTTPVVAPPPVPLTPAVIPAPTVAPEAAPKAAPGVAPAVIPALTAVPEAAPKAAPEVAPEVDVEATVREAPESSGAPQPPAASAAAPPEGSESVDSGYDYLFGDTMFRSVSDAVVHDTVADEADESAVVDDTLHDGETVLTSDIAKIRGKRRAKKEPVESAPAQNLVLAVSTTGTRESLAQPILVGRSPSVSQISGGQIPRLLTVGTPDQDISRNHVQVTLEGGTVVVTDLHSRNGTMIELPGKSPQKLRAGEPTSVILGTVIDLGSGVTLTVEEGDA